MTTSLSPEDERARKRQAIGLTARRPTAKEVVHRPPDQRDEWGLRWFAVTLLLILALATGWMVWDSLQREFDSLTDGEERLRLILEDNFNTPQLALADDRIEGLWHAGFIDDHYRISVEQPGNLTWSTLGLLNASAYRIETAMILASSTENGQSVSALGYGGLLVRYSNDQNFYLFAVDGQGAYQVQLQKEGVWQVLRPWTTVQTLSAMDTPIYLGVEDDGSQIKFLGNGELLFTVDEPRLPSGDVGLAGGTRSQGQVSTLFDWVKIYEVPLATP